MNSIKEWYKGHVSRTVPQLSTAGCDALAQSGIDDGLISNFFQNVSVVAELIDAVPQRITITFPATRSLPDDPSREDVVAHWRDIAGRTFLAKLTANRTLRELLRGFILALEHRNVLTLAHTARASLEHAASYSDLSRYFTGRKERFEAEVLPYLREESPFVSSGPPLDRKLINELILFQNGARLWPTGDCPSTPKEWRLWCEQSRYEPAKEGEEQSRAGQFLDLLGINQKNILTQLERISRTTQHMAALGLYSMLSEFCHPNCENRSIGIQANSVEVPLAYVEFAGTLSWTPGAVRGTWLSILAMTEAMHIHIAAYNMIYDSAHDLVLEIELQP